MEKAVVMGWNKRTSKHDMDALFRALNKKHAELSARAGIIRAELKNLEESIVALVRTKAIMSGSYKP